MATVYVLLSLKDLRTYTGSTSNIERRFQEHTGGKVKSTKNRRPLKIIYKEDYKNVLEARAREMYLKSTTGRRELRKILKDIID